MNVLYRLLQGIMIIGLVSVAGLYWILTPIDPPKLQAFINANVVTVDSEKPRAEAVLIEGEKIVAIGSTKEITALIQSHPKRSKVKVRDLVGKTLMPGFIDAHSHFPGSGLYEFAADLNAPPIGNIASISQLQAALRDADLLNENGGWLLGLGYDDTLMSEGRHPMRQELDAVSTDRPIFVLHVSGHMGVANTSALRALGIDSNSIPPDGGNYDKNSQGQLSGLILEAAVMPVLQRATAYSPFQTYRIAKRAAAEYASQGVTAVQSGGADKRNATGLRWASKFSVVPQRITVWPLHDALDVQSLADIKRQETPKFEIGAIKLIADGSIQVYTAYLSEPYHVSPNSGVERFRGKPMIEAEHLKALVSSYFAKSQQLAIHGNGDASIDDILAAVEHAIALYPRADHRTVLIHAQMARKDQLEKMQELGVTPSFFSAHTYYWGDRHRDLFIGSERTSRISPANSAEKLGLPFSIHLDTPVVPMQSMRLLWSAVNRQSSTGRTIGRRERITREQAIKAVTLNAAYQIFRDDTLGSIEVGKLADLVVLDKDPSDTANDLLDIQVLNTFVGGVEIYTRSVGR